MIEKMQSYDVVADFWERYQRRHERAHGPIARLALDKCEETFMRREWDSFGYWHTIYHRERFKALNSKYVRDRR